MQNSRYMCVILAMAAALPAAAQSFTGTILGTVRDASGAIVPNATVTAINSDNNQKREATTDASGVYSVPLLPPGKYSIEAVAQGFRKFVQEGIVLQVQQQARVDISLTLGAVSESVTVTADAPVVESTTSSVGKVVDNRRIRDLPLNTRNVYALIYLTPGVTGSIGNNYNSLSYAVNGARRTMMDTIVDGVTASFPTVNGFTGISVFPSVDAIEEFKVMGANYSAEFGRSLGSVLNVVFKSGTNSFHGSAYEFLRNSVLDANNFFDNRRGSELASFKRSQFGGTAGGPIRRDKTFFLGSYEGLRERSFANRTFTVPTELERQGDFTRTLASNGQQVRIFDPSTTRPNPSGSGFIRDAFPGNVIPASRFDPVAVNAMKYFPLPNTPGTAVTNLNNYSRSGARGINLDQTDARVDHHLNSRQKIFGRYSYRLTQDVPVVSFPDEIKIAEGRIIQENHVHSAVADYSNTLTPNTILSARLGFARTLYVYNNQGLGFLPSSLGLPKDIDAVVDRQMFPRFGPSGYVSLGGNDHRYNAFMSYTALANVSHVKGRHTLKYGYEGRLLRVNVWEARSAGTFNFSAGFTQGPNPNQASSTAGNSIASLLLGTGTSNNVLIQGWKNVAAQSFYHAAYFQDDWRITSRLTLNLGLRYDLDTPRTERYNRMNYLDPFARNPLADTVPEFPDLRGGVVFVGVGGQSRHQYDWDTNNLAPRVGLAYQLTSKTVIRAAYGHVFGPSNQGAQGTVGPFGFRVEYPWLTTLDGITPYNVLRNPYPQGFREPPGAAEGLLTQAGANLQAVLPDTVTPWAMQWNFTVQQELPAQILMEVAYVGTRGLQLARGGESGFTINQLTTDKLALGSRLNDRVPNPFFGKGTGGFFVSPTISRAQLLRPFPQFTDVIPLYSAGASSSYHSLQVTTSKRLSKGILFEGSYTWAKNLDYGMSHQNSYDISDSKSLADADLTHNFVMSWVYELPFGRGRKFGSAISPLVNTVLGGWQLNGITILQTGTPLQITASNTAGLFNAVTRPNNNGRSARKTGPVHERIDAYFDKTVFSQPAPFTLGNVSPRVSDLRSDGVRNFDLSLFKDFVPKEYLRVQFRAEFLNAFNTPRFGGPNTSVTSRDMGVINSQANTPRQIQFGLKLIW
ncbi:MAG: TonB-dependent receptor [Acidobacteria bacterium]|nr:TonB-dependent receptor [Acidobacteriota bacterium]